MNSQTAHPGGATAPAPIHPRGRRFARRPAAHSRNLLFLLLAALGFLPGCGVQSPPQPPRIERPAQIKDLRAGQTGRTFHLEFTLPALATDGERLSKPVELEIFRAAAPPGGTPAPPSTSGAPWARVLPRDLGRYLRKGKVDYPIAFSAQEYPQQMGSTFSFSVVALTRGFRGHPRASAPSNVAQAKLLDASQPVSNLAVQATQAALELSWPAPDKTLLGRPAANLAAYRIYGSSTGKPGTFQLIAETKVPRFADPDFQFGKAYYFQVRAVSALGSDRAESEPSATAEITPRDIFPPSVPQRLTAIYTAGAVDLLWSANTDVDLAGYNVYRKTAGGEFARLNPQLVSTPIFHDTSVAPGRNYEYAVAAVDLSGNESAQSKPVEVSTSLPGGP